MTAFSVHARLRGLDRAVLAERAATALRKTHDINAACAQLGISRKFLRSLAQEYDFPIQSYQRASTWPQRHDPGQPSDYVNRWLATNYVKARKAASEAMKGRPAPPSTTAPPPACGECNRAKGHMSEAAFLSAIKGSASVPVHLLMVRFTRRLWQRTHLASKRIRISSGLEFHGPKNGAAA